MLSKVSDNRAEIFPQEYLEKYHALTEKEIEMIAIGLAVSGVIKTEEELKDKQRIEGFIDGLMSPPVGSLNSFTIYSAPIN